MRKILQAYLYKYYWEQRYYLPNFVFEVLGHLLFFLGLFTLLFQPDPTRFLQGLLGFLLWMISLTIMYESAMLVWEDSLLGTLEHVYMSPHPFWQILLGRMVANLILHTGLYSIFLVGALGTYRLMGHTIHIPPVAWPWMAFSVAILFFASWGMGLILFGVALVVKRAGSITGFLYWVLFFTSGALFSVKEQPRPFQILAWTTPIGPAGMVMADSLRPGSPMPLLLPSLLHTCLYVLLGFVVMHLGLHYARKTGKMARY